MGAEHRELNIESMLADPLIRAANKADHVSLQDFERLLRATAAELKSSGSARRPAVFGEQVSRGRCGDWSACFA